MAPPLRKSVLDLTVQEMDNLVKAFQEIKAEDPTSPNSFFTIASYHGIPGGFYCHHGDVLFPTWHRAYLYRLEQALQSKVPGVTLPYWDQVNAVEKISDIVLPVLTGPGEIPPDGTPFSVIPPILTEKTYTFADGTTIENPLFSYRLQKSITDSSSGGLYTKPEGYDTVRFPFSGLVNDEYAKETAAHNETCEAMGSAKTTQMLNNNAATWLLASTYVTSKGERRPAGVKNRYLECLQVPNYTVFSNTTSATEWNDKHREKVLYPIESPHNAMHLAVGGIQVPDYDASSYPFANGDMGDNETAGFDPIFYFHHCYIDYMFWQWQVFHESTQKLEFISGYPGVEDKTPQSPLEPFKTPDGSRFLTSEDVVNIENLGYSYPNVLRGPVSGQLPSIPKAPTLQIGNLSRRNIRGSFVISTWAKNQDGEFELITCEPILSRWNVNSCENCTNHLDFEAFVPLIGWSKEEASTAFHDHDIVVKVHTKVDPTRQRDLPVGAAPGAPGGDDYGLQPTLQLEVGHLG